MYIPMFSPTHMHTRSKPLLKFIFISSFALLLFLFAFFSGGHANPQSTVYKLTHKYTPSLGIPSWLSGSANNSAESTSNPEGNKLGTWYEGDYGENEDWVEGGGDGKKSQRTFNVALTERTGHHDEVLGAFLYTLSTSSRISNITVYRNSYRYGFSEITEPFFPHPLVPADSLFDALNSTFASISSESTTSQTVDHPGLQKHDVLILSSCDQTLPSILPSLLASLSLLPPSSSSTTDSSPPFKILCIVHNAAHSPHTIEKMAAPLVERGMLVFVVLSHSVSNMLRESVFELAEEEAEDNSKEDGKIGWDRVPVEVFVPIYPVPFPVKESGEREVGGAGDKDALEAIDGDTVYEPLPKGTGKRILSNVVVQGNIDPHRRDYISLFRDFSDALDKDPAFWGYKPLNSSSSGAYEPLTIITPAARLSRSIPETTPTPFVLHLAGSLLPLSSPTQSPPIPASLSNIVKIHPSLSYPDFYVLMHSMDLVIPAFARDAYYKSSASSTVPASVIAEVPILGTRRLLNAYQYLDGRTSILRPGSMSEIEAVRLLRMGVLPDEYEYPDGHDNKRKMEKEEDDEDDEAKGSTHEKTVGSTDEGATSPSNTAQMKPVPTEGNDASTSTPKPPHPLLDPRSLSRLRARARARLRSRSLLRSNTHSLSGSQSGSYMAGLSGSQRNLPPFYPPPNQIDIIPRYPPFIPRSNPPQNTQDKRSLGGRFQRIPRTVKEDKQLEKKKWDGDMKTLTSPAAMKAMRDEVYARNERLLIRAFGG